MGDTLRKIAIGCDHAGYKYKELLKNFLESQSFTVKDFGTVSEDSVDYPDIIHPLARAVNRDDFRKGIIICGSGNGVAMVANKYPNVRAAVCWNDEITRLSRLHNDANIIALPARFISREQALEFVKIFISTPFEGGRHSIRVEKISGSL
jgi:ribose 5-phosphate isomerase B